MGARLSRHPLGSTGLEVSPLGLTALSVTSWGGGGPKLSPEDVERAFHEHGVNIFLVHSMMPEICAGVRRLVKAGYRDELVLVSEASLPFPGSLRRGLEKQLDAAGTDRLDVWLIGWVRGRWYLRTSMVNTLAALKAEGKVRAVGFSCHDRPLAAALARELPVDVLMMRYNAAHRGAEREIFPQLEEMGPKRPGVIAYTATRWGMLLKPLPRYGFASGMTGPECYRFVLGHPMIDAVWCAARTAEELDQDVAGAIAGPLPGDRLAEVQRFGDAVHATAKGGFRWMFGSSSG